MKRRVSREIFLKECVEVKPIKQESCRTCGSDDIKISERASFMDAKVIPMIKAFRCDSCGAFGETKYLDKNGIELKIKEKKK